MTLQKYPFKFIFKFKFQLIGADQKMPVNFVIKARLTTDTLVISPGKINFGRIFEGLGSRVGITFENQSLLPQELIFYPLIREISVELDLIPIKILPNEKLSTHLIYRSAKNEKIDVNKKDEGFLRIKKVTGTISTKDIRIPYFCEIMKCPLEFNGLKFDLPVQ